MMRHLAFWVMASCVVLSMPSFANTVLSKHNCWRTVSDKNGKVQSIVMTWKEKASFYGKILKTYKVKGLPYYKYCTNCYGSYKDRRIEGMIFIWGGRQKSPSRWGGLRILDPQSGKIYRATVRLNSSGDRLKVRGYIGLPIFGRTQVWLKTVCPNHTRGLFASR